MHLALKGSFPTALWQKELLILATNNHVYSVASRKCFFQILCHCYEISSISSLLCSPNLLAALFLLQFVSLLFIPQKWLNEPFPIICFDSIDNAPYKICNNFLLPILNSQINCWMMLTLLAKSLARIGLKRNHICFGHS